MTAAPSAVPASRTAAACPDLLDGGIDPSPVFGPTPGLDEVPVGYRAMDEPTALKVLITP